MNCPHCGMPLNEGVKFCPGCGNKVNEVRAAAPNYESRPAGNYRGFTAESIPPQYRPLSPWAYFGYAILFSIPLVGFICLIVFSLSDDNINRRNYARSYWCVLLLAVILIVVFLALGLSFGFLDQVADLYPYF